MDFSSILQPDERIIYKFTKAEKDHKILIWLGAFFVIAGILASLYISIALAGFLFVIGFVLIILYLVTRKSLFFYLVTNKRVMVVKVKRGTPIITNSCWISEIQRVVNNVWTVSKPTSNEKSSTGTYTEQEYGNIVFIKDGQVCLEFYNVPNPYNIRDGINDLK